MRERRLRGLGDAISDAIAASIGSDYTSQSITPSDITGITIPADTGTSSMDTVTNQLFPVSSPDVTTPVVSDTAPSASSDPNSLNQMISYAGQLFQYVQQGTDANGNPLYVPQPVVSSGSSNLMMYAALAALAYLMFA